MPACVCKLHVVPVRQAALVSDESALEACLRRCAIQIDDLYLFTFLTSSNSTVINLNASTTNAAVVVRTRTQFRKRAFYACGSSIWNQTYSHIRNLHSTSPFCKALYPKFHYADFHRNFPARKVVDTNHESRGHKN